MGQSTEMTPLAQTLAEMLDREHPTGVVSAYLFGSHASGTSHDESDVDVAVLLDYRLHRTARDRFDMRVGLTSMLIGALHVDAMDVVVLNDAPPLFARRIVREGVRVYCVDRQTDRDFLRDVQLRAADLQPFLKRARRTKLAALER